MPGPRAPLEMDLTQPLPPILQDTKPFCSERLGEWQCDVGRCFSQDWEGFFLVFLLAPLLLNQQSQADWH
jgi:hypothetical protein